MQLVPRPGHWMIFDAPRSAQCHPGIEDLGTDAVADLPVLVGLGTRSSRRMV